MAFENGSKELEFFKQIQKFSDETKKLGIDIEIRKVRQKYSSDPNTANQKRQNLMDELSLNDRKDFASDLSEEIKLLIQKIDKQFNLYLDEILKVGMNRAKLKERIEIFAELSTFIKLNSSPDLIFEHMNNMFGNEHVWKKEFSTGFLNSLRLYSKTPTEDGKNRILKQISMLSTSSYRHPNTYSTELATLNDSKKMTYEETTKAYKELCSKIDDLRTLETFAGIVLNTLEEIKRTI